MLEHLVRGQPRESLTIESGPALLETRDGKRIRGSAGAVISRSSITVRFNAEEEAVVAEAAYGESSGSIAALDGSWAAPQVNDAGTASNGDRLFATMALITGRAAPQEAAATRLVTAGGAWQGSGVLYGRRVVIHPLSHDVASHHDLRMAIALEGDADASTIAAMERACGFVSGIDVELLRVERYSAESVLTWVEHRRGYRRLGRGPHSPFTGLPDEYRMQAWLALVSAYPRLLADGIPIDMILDQISAHNQVAQINVSSQLLLLATVTAAHQRLHGDEVGAAAASRNPELERLDHDLGLGLSTEDFDRYERLRVELLDGGYFHKPGYETGRPQRDIKFLRDLAHMVVFRLCGYSGPFYGAERFAVREMTAPAS
jgi:hypothetical protein